MGKVIFITGAGTGVESGIQAFRVDTESGKSMWDEYDVDEVCNYGRFITEQRVYRKTNEFYNKRRVELGTILPNAFHEAVAALYKEFPDKVVNITTNVDDLLECAGIPKKDVMHVHGYLTEIIFMNDDKKVVKDIGYMEVDIDAHKWFKPNVVFFGEYAPLYQEMANVFADITPSDTVIIVGCSNKVLDFVSMLGYMTSSGVNVHYVDPYISEEDKSYCWDWGIKTHEMTAVDFAKNKLHTLCEGLKNG